MTRNDCLLIALLMIISLAPLVPSSQFLVPNHALIKVDGGRRKKYRRNKKRGSQRGGG